MFYVIARVLAAKSYMHVKVFFVLYYSSCIKILIIHLRLLGMVEKVAARKVLVTLGDNNENAQNPRKRNFVSHEKPKPLFNHCKFDAT